MMQDSIDFGTMNIPKLFRMMFIPTLLGMVLSATINIADGIFVGRGVGSDALAAVNIVAPFFMLATGIGLMFGVGASIVASIHLSHQKVKVANINITQALSVSLCIMLSLSLLVMTFRAEVALLLGSSEQLLPSVLEYMNWNNLRDGGAGTPRHAVRDRPVPCLLHVIEYRVIHYPVRRITYIRHVMQRYPGPDKPNIRLYFRFPIALGINGSRFSFRYFRNRRKYYDRGLYRRFF